MNFAVLGLVALSFCAWRQGTSRPEKTAPTPVIIKWVDNLSGDFSFTANWSYPIGVYKNEYGQISCDGLCPPEIDAMKDSLGRIYEDSLRAFYKTIDTTHQKYSIQCEVWCYEYEGTDFIEVNRLTNGNFHCFTLTSISTHCSLNIDIRQDSCYATIDLSSIGQAGSIIFHCTDGVIKIDKNLWREGIMKAEFSFNFEHEQNPEKPVYWKGKIFARINMN